MTSSTAPGTTAELKVRIVPPTRLGAAGKIGGVTIPHWPSFVRRYEGQDVSLLDMVIANADRFGIPPQYLMSQMFAEVADLNPYAIRYEPSSRDWKHLTGSWVDTVRTSRRRLMTPGRAYSRLALTNARGQIEYMPCETGNGDRAPCIAAEPPSQLQILSIGFDGTSSTFRIGSPPTGVADYEQRVIPSTSPWTDGKMQVYTSDCGGPDPLPSSRFCFGNYANEGRFSEPPPQGTLSLGVYPLVRVERPPTSPGLTDAEFESLVAQVCSNASPDPVAPSTPCFDSRHGPMPRYQTLSQWARQKVRRGARRGERHIVPNGHLWRVASKGR